MTEEKKKILLVDDEPDIVTILKMRLEANGYEVSVAVDGKIAYNMAKSTVQDLIILDLMLPGMDGHHVCRLLKFDEKYRNIPVIILTAKGQKEDQEIAKEVGADAFLTKPVDFKELLDKIKELITR